VIRHEDGKYVLYSRDGQRKLGTYATEAEAQKRDRVVARLSEAYSGEALEARVSAVRDAYYGQMAPLVSPSEIDSPYLMEVRDESVIVCKGREYFEVPYAIADDGAVTFGEPTRVQMTYTALGESQLVPPANGGRAQFLALREAAGGLPRGSVWDVRIIAPGFSKNVSPDLRLPRYYPADVLREAVTRFDDVRIFMHDAAPHVERWERRAQDVVGWLRNPRYDSGIVAEFHLVDAGLRTKLTEAWDRGKRDLVGFSINAEGREEAGLAEGIRAAIVRAIGPRVHSTDVVTDPAAGGELVTLVASIDPPTGGGHTMDLAQLLAMVRGIRPELVATEPQGGWTAELLQAKLREALAQPTVDSAATIASLQESLRQTSTLIEGLQSANRQRDRREQVRVALDASPLMRVVPARTAVESRMAVSLLEADEARFKAVLDGAIAEQVAVVTALAEAGRVQGFGASHATVLAESRDKWDKAMDGMIAGKKQGDVDPFRSIHHSWYVVTGERSWAPAIPTMMEALAFYQPKQVFGEPNPKRQRWLTESQLRESITTTTWAEIFGDSITRRMQAEYAMSNLNDWRKIVSETPPIRDFRTNRRPRMGGYGVLSIVGQGAPYNPMATPGDEEVTYAIAKRGGTEDFTIETMANDDVGALRRIPRELARAAAWTLRDFVFDFIRTNPTMPYDGVALFHATHGNLGSGVLSAANLKAAIVAMRSQTVAGSGKPLGGVNAPVIILVPNELEDMAFKLSTSLVDVGAASEAGTTPNVIQARYRMEVIVVDEWTDATDWALCANPANVPTIEVGFWNGQEEPELFIQDQPTAGSVFTADKFTYKLRHVYGGSPLDHRGLWKSEQ
jgi:hypothetical protein